MTQHELAAKLDHLDPGGCIEIETRQLAELFGAGALTDGVVHEAEAFAERHRCSLVRDEHDRSRPQFVKDDVF